MNTTRTKVVDQMRDHRSQHIAFGVADDKGREIGARIATGVHEFVPTADDWMFFDRAPGVYFYLDPQATRNGKKYGACQRERYFDTAVERDAALERYLADAKKRALNLARVAE